MAYLLLNYTDARGETMQNGETAGYNADDFFSDGGLTQAKRLLSESRYGDGRPTTASDLLGKTYKGRNSDNIGLQWTVIV